MDGEKKPGSDSVDARSWGKEALNPIKSQLMQEEIEQEKVRNRLIAVAPTSVPHRPAMASRACFFSSENFCFCPAAAAHSQSICVAFLIVLSS